MSVLERVGRLGLPLDPDALEDVLEELLAGRLAPAAAAPLLDELSERPVTPEVLVAGANVLRRHSVAVSTPPNRAIIDTCGTGSDGFRAINLSTGAAILIAACDGTVVKQAGSLSVDDAACGSLDVLSALGFPVNLPPNRVRTALVNTGFAVLPTGRFLPARERLARLLPTGGARALLRLWTPLANPAFPDAQLVGVHDPKLTEPMARALGLLGVDRALVVHCGGLAEVGLHADTVGHTCIGGEIKAFHLAGTGAPLSALAGGTAAMNAELLTAAFSKKRGPVADAIALNAAAAMWIARLLPTLSDARQWARQRLAQGIDLDEFRS